MDDDLYLNMTGMRSTHGYGLAEDLMVVTRIEELERHSTLLNQVLHRLAMALHPKLGKGTITKVDPELLTEEAVAKIKSKRPEQWVYIVLLPVPMGRLDRWLGKEQRWFVHDDDWNAWGDRDRAKQSAKMWRPSDLHAVVSTTRGGTEVIEGKSKSGRPLWRVLGLHILRNDD